MHTQNFQPTGTTKDGQFLRVLLLALLLGILVATPPVHADDEGRSGRRLVGSWLIRATFDPDQVLPDGLLVEFVSLMTFGQDRTVVETSTALPLSSVGSGHGAWKGAGGRRFSFTILKPVTAALVGTCTVLLRVNGVVDFERRDRENFSGPFSMDVSDCNTGEPIPGIPVFGVLEGARIGRFTREADTRSAPLGNRRR